MDQRIQLMHPAGKKAVSIDKGKYDLIKKTLINYLKKKGEATHSEILQAITEDFKRSKIKFEGSVEWHVEWVKLDLEAKKEIKRIISKPQIKFMLT
jgi:ribosomal protein L1